MLELSVGSTGSHRILPPLKCLPSIRPNRSEKTVHKTTTVSRFIATPRIYGQNALLRVVLFIYNSGCELNYEIISCVSTRRHFFSPTSRELKDELQVLRRSEKRKRLPSPTRYVETTNRQETHEINSTQNNEIMPWSRRRILKAFSFPSTVVTEMLQLVLFFQM